MKTHLIIYIAICLFANVCNGANNHFAARLHKMEMDCEKARSLSQYECLAQNSQDMITMAQQVGDKRAETYGLFYNGLAQLFMGQAQSALDNLNKANDLAERTTNDSVRALATNALGIYHAMMGNNKFVAQQYFFKSLNLAKKAGHEDLQYRVRGNLLTLSQSTGGNRVLENARMVYDYGVKHHNNEQIAMGTYYLATYYYKQENYVETEKYLKIAIDTYKEYPYEDIASVYALYAKLLLSQNKTDEAQEMAEKAVELAGKYHQTSLEVDALIALSEVLSHQNKHLESISYAEQALNKALEIGMESKVIDCLNQKATSLMATGLAAEAMQCMQKSNKLLKEQASINIEQLAHEQQIMQEMERKEAEAIINEREIHSQRVIMAFLAITVFVLLTLLAYAYFSYRHRQALYKKIVLQNTRAVARQKALQQQIEALSKEKDVVPNELELPEKKSLTIDEEKMNKLYTQLCWQMEHERLYTEPQLTREKVAEILGTNRTYLTKVIKDKTGMNFLQYINSYRINEAISILSDKEKVNYPLKQIWNDLGFSSPSTFFKLFQQTLGITPSIYRKQFMEVNESNSNTTDDEE